MAYSFVHKPFEWTAAGSAPSQADIDAGFSGGDSLRADWLNKQWTDTCKAIEEIQDGIESETFVNIDDALSGSSTNPVQNKIVKAALDNKVEKVTGKGLSDENFTAAYKAKLDTIDSTPTSGSTNFVKSGGVYDALADKVDKVAGKGLSEENFTDYYKNAIENLTPITVDSALSEVSTNPVQNQAIATAIEDLQSMVYPSITVNGYPNTEIILTCGAKTITVTPDSTGIVTVFVPIIGIWTVSTTYGGETKTTTVNCAEMATNYVAYLIVSPVLDDNPPSVIQSTAQSGEAPNIWSVGDKVGIQMSGTIGSLALNDKYYAFIIGFNHNATIEGNNSIHFQFGKTADGTKTIAFVDSQYNTQQSGNYFTMNTSNTNSGGWASSRMRTTLMPQFKAAMPSEWQSIISPCTKYSDNTGGGSDTASYVTATTDDIFLLAEYEVQGAKSYANSKEKDYQQQYSYYANGNSKIFYKYNDTSAACIWWLRSVYAAHPNYFCNVSTDGSANGSGASNSLGLASGFKVA